MLLLDSPAEVAVAEATEKRLNDGNKRQSVEIQVTNVGPDLQFQSAEVKRATSTEKKQSA